MANLYVVAAVYGRSGCLAYRCKTLSEAKCLPRILEETRADNVQIVVLNSPEIYAEYAPYTFIEDIVKFIEKASQLNRSNT